MFNWMALEHRSRRDVGKIGRNGDKASLSLLGKGRGIRSYKRIRSSVSYCPNLGLFRMQSQAQAHLLPYPEEVIDSSVLITFKIFRHLIERFTCVHLLYSYLISFIRPFLPTFSTWCGLQAVPVRPPAEDLPPSLIQPTNNLATSTRYGKLQRIIIFKAHDYRLLTTVTGLPSHNLQKASRYGRHPRTHRV
jgi:hypothetical protein